MIVIAEFRASEMSATSAERRLCFGLAGMGPLILALTLQHRHE